VAIISKPNIVRVANYPDHLTNTISQLLLGQQIMISWRSLRLPADPRSNAINRSQC